MDTLVVATTCHVFALAPLFSGFLTYYLIVHTRLWWLMLIYLAFCYSDRHTSSTGGRPWKSFREWRWWKYHVSYNSIKIHQAGDKEFHAKKNYLLCSFPHGILPTGIAAALCTTSTTFHQLFPHHQYRIAILSFLYDIPFFREILLAGGGIGSSFAAISHVLSKPEGGYFVGLMPGGAQEAFYCRPGHHTIVLKKRKGFVKLALKTGASLVPVYTFGETDLFTQIQNKYIVTCLDKLRKILGFAPIIPIGRGLFPYSFGFTQFKMPLNVVVGDPIDVEKNDNPTDESIMELHTKFTNALIQLFEEQKHLYIKHPENVHLEIVE